MQITAVREGIAAAAAAVVMPEGTAKLKSYAYVPDDVVAPCFFVAEVDITFDKTFGRGTDELTFTCRVLISAANDRTSQRLLDRLLSGAGEGSLKQAIEVARGVPGELALGGAADDLHIQRVQGYRWYEHAGAQYVGAELVIKVIGDGSS
ncbi:hypothetical protein ACIBAC_28975 [Streptomyces sp. NPDC051362]|uniref:hypothetical protein n=1 Tax=Streptomyces sp. NPDC051362 TaxID=3365651 RepID=UPI0037A803B3